MPVPKLPRDPDGANRQRAEAAKTALAAFRTATGCDGTDAVRDLLCNLMHLCDRSGEEFAVAFDAALNAYRAETDRVAA